MNQSNKIQVGPPKPRKLPKPVPVRTETVALARAMFYLDGADKRSQERFMLTLAHRFFPGAHINLSPLKFVIHNDRITPDIEKLFR